MIKNLVDTYANFAFPDHPVYISNDKFQRYFCSRIKFNLVKNGLGMCRLRTHCLNSSRSTEFGFYAINNVAVFVLQRRHCLVIPSAFKQYLHTTSCLLHRPSCVIVRSNETETRFLTVVCHLREVGVLANIPQPATVDMTAIFGQREQDRKVRREIANSNERRRMQSINAGFKALKTILPQTAGEKLSKVSEYLNN